MYEYRHNGRIKKAVYLYHRPSNYSDAKTGWFFENEQAARDIAALVNDAREHQFSEYAEVTTVPNGAVLTITEPYDD